MTRKRSRPFGQLWSGGAFLAVCLALAVGGYLFWGQSRMSWELGAPQVRNLPPDPHLLTLKVLVLASVPVTAEQDDAGASVLKRRADEHPVPGATVTAFVADEERVFHEAATGESDEHGRVTLASLPDAPLWLRVEKPGFARRFFSVLVSAEPELRVELTPAQTAEIRVEDPEGAAIAGATVLMDDADPLPFGALTDGAGVAHFSRLGFGPWRLSAYAVGYAPGRIDVAGATETIVLHKQPRFIVRVVDAQGAPAPDAKVLIVGASLWPARYAKTDAQGEALLEALAAGSYEVWAHRGAELSPVTAIVLSPEHAGEAELTLGPGRMVTIAVRQESASLGAGPVADAEVVLSDRGVGAFPLTGRTDAKGNITLGPVPLEAGVVSVFAEGFVGPGPLAVPADAAQPFEVVLHQAATLRGHVTDAAGRPIAGARVEVIGIDTRGQPVSESPLLSAYRSAHFEASLRPQALIAAGELGVTLGAVPSVAQAVARSFEALPTNYRPWVTSLEGEFRASPVPAGRLRALVRHPGYVEALSAPVEVGFGGEARVSVVLSEGARLRGVVVDEFERPVPGARVKVVASQGGFEESAIADGSGRFALNAVPHGVVALVARPDNITRFVSRAELSLEAGREQEVTLQLPVERGAARVRIFGYDDRPLELSQVELASVDPGVPVRESRFSDAGGWVEFEDVVGLRARLRISAPGYVAEVLQLAALPRETTVTLTRGMVVTGRVTAVRGRAVVSGARITVVSGESTLVTTSDASGEFRLAQVGAGRAHLSVSHPEHAAVERDIDVADTGFADRPFEIGDIELAERAVVEGLVLDASGEAVSGAWVGAKVLVPRGFPNQVPEGVVATDEDGRFSLPIPAEAGQRLYAFHGVHGRAEGIVDASSGRVEDVALRFSPAGDVDDPGVAQGGLLVVLGERDTSTIDWVIFAQVAPGSEAERAGLRVGDALLAVDGTFPRGLANARQLLLGRPGSDVVIDVQREDEQLSFRVRRELTR